MDEQYKNKALAEELAEKLSDHNNIGFYYTLAQKYDHLFLRNILGWVSDYKNPDNKGALFTWKLRNEVAKKSIPSENNFSDEASRNLAARKKELASKLSIDKEYE